MRHLLYIIIIYSCICCKGKTQDVCNWTEYLESINKQNGAISLHPSENGFKPALKNSSSENGLKLMLQDFRQFEFVSQSYKTLAAKEITAIEKVRADNVIKTGPDSGFFAKVYIRRSIPDPINKALTLPELKKILVVDFEVDSLIITNCDLKPVDRGFSFVLDGIPFYGVTNAKGEISLLGILEVEPQYDTKDNHDKIKRLLIEKGLLLIAWNNGSILEPKDFE